MIVIAYGPQGPTRFMSGSDEDVRQTMLELEGEGFAVRRLDDTPLANLGTTLDPRLPPTVAAFDAQFPDALEWRDLPA